MNRISVILISLLALMYAKPTLCQMVDGHIHGGFQYGEQAQLEADFSYFQERHIQAFAFPLPVKRIQTLDLVSALTGEVNELKTLADQLNSFQIVEHSDNSIDDRIAVFLEIEYFYGVFGGTANSVDHYKDIGVRSITLVNNQYDELFDGGKLSSFGIRIIDRMNTARIFIDISHLDEDQAVEVIKHSRKPVMASHSAAWSVANRGGNLTDKILNLMRKTGAYVFVSFNTNGLFPRGIGDQEGVRQLVAHIQFLKQKLDSDHIGIGSDYQAAGQYVPDELGEKDSYQQIAEELNADGCTEEEVGKIMGGNFLRAMGIYN